MPPLIAPPLGPSWPLEALPLGSRGAHAGTPHVASLPALLPHQLVSNAVTEPALSDGIEGSGSWGAFIIALLAAAVIAAVLAVRRARANRERRRAAEMEVGELLVMEADASEVEDLDALDEEL